MQYLKLSVAFLFVTCGSIACSSKDPVERAYQDCMDKMKAQVGDKMRSDVAKAGNPAGMGDAMVGMAEGLGKGMCDMIKTTCKQDPNGPICQAAINQYK